MPERAPAFEILDRISDPVFVADKDLLIRHANPAALKLIDQNLATLAGESLENFVTHHKVFLMSLLNPFKNTDAQNESVEVQVISKNGDRIALLSAGFMPVEETQWVVVLKDVSQLKKDQEREAEKQLELAKNSRLESIGTLAGGVAHEINNPLAIILGYAQRLIRMSAQRDFDEKKLQDVADKIQHTALRINKIIGSLQLLAKDGDDEAFEMMSLKDALMGTVELLRSKAKMEGIEMHFDFTDDDCEIRMRPSQISQLCFHLIVNSIDAVSALNEKWIRVELKVVDSFVELGVVDSGSGIPRDLRDQIMLPFFTTKDPGKGTGLGLSIALRVAKDHSGELSLDTRSPNTRFLAKFPKANQPLTMKPLRAAEK